MWILKKAVGDYVEQNNVVSTTFKNITTKETCHYTKTRADIVQKKKSHGQAICLSVTSLFETFEKGFKLHVSHNLRKPLTLNKMTSY